MSQCKHYDICGRDVEGDPADGLCILHSTDPAKDTHAFAEALVIHRERYGDNFVRFVFPRRADFFGATFTKGADFGEATFSEGADFSGATFSEGADFGGATFSEGADFGGATFSEGADFSRATFSEGADFSRATFSEGADFGGATFSGKTFFARRLGSAEAASNIFAGTEVDFREVVIDPPDAVTFVDADLTKCRFQDTDLRKVQMVGEKWPQPHWHKISRRTVVYDECLLWKGTGCEF